MAVACGDRRARVKFQRRAAADDGAGNKEGDWVDFIGPFWAKMRSLTGREEVLAQRLAGLDPYEVRLQGCAALLTLTPQDRMMDLRTNKTFNVTSVSDPEMRRQEYVVLVTAGQNDG